MNMPGFTAETALYPTHQYYRAEAQYPDSISAEAVLPQQCVRSRCYRVGARRLCVRLPIVGRRCVNIPYLGRWRIRCCRSGWFPPRIRCRPIRC